MKILVAGGTGLLGSTLCPVLKEHGCEVYSHGRSAKDIAFDATIPGDVSTSLDATNPDVVINLVCLSNVDTCETNPDQAKKLNTDVVAHFAKWCAKNQRKLVQISTDHVYDSATPSAEHEVQILNQYAHSKHQGEVEASIANALILRTNFFGPSQCANRTSFSDWVISSFRGSDKFNLFTDVTFSPLSMKRLSEILLECLKVNLGGTFNLGSNEGMTKRDFAHSLAVHLGLDPSNAKDASMGETSLATPRPSNMWMNCHKLESALGITLPTLQEEIQTL